MSRPTAPQLARRSDYRAARSRPTAATPRSTAEVSVSGPAWDLTSVVIAGLTMCDYAVHIRETHAPTVREAINWSAIYPTKGPILDIDYFAGDLSNEARKSTDCSFFGSSRAALSGMVFALVATTFGAQQQNWFINVRQANGLPPRG